MIKGKGIFYNLRARIMSRREERNKKKNKKENKTMEHGA